MANCQHIQLSTFIKSVHSSLREKAKFIGFQEAWTEHLEDQTNLVEYAKAMQTLATSHWQSNFTKNSKAQSRIEWIHEFCLKYFCEEENSELLKQRRRDIEISNKINITPETDSITMNEKPILLDVGSCYNPFAAYDYFKVTAIDIAPACAGVHKLDFLNVKITNSLELNSKNLSLKCDFFDVVVFSLFLEYLPNPDLRFQCCEKAYRLLKTEGILFIITPDSKHVGANAPIMKTWRFILSQMGFSRIKYEKLSHIHCMVFRKSLDARISRRWADLNQNAGIYDKLYIPQDLQEHEITNNDVMRSPNSNNANFLSEMPISDEYFETGIS